VPPHQSSQPKGAKFPLLPMNFFDAVAAICVMTDDAEFIQAFVD
jgi:hypothetical protein